MKRLSLLLFLVLPAWGVAGAAQVQQVQGQVFYSAGEHQPSTSLSLGSHVDGGTFIRTEGQGSAFVSPFPSSTLYFGPMSDGQMSRLVGAGNQDGYAVNQADVDLYSGKITAFINNHGKQGTEFTLRTSGAIISATSAIFVTCVSDVGMGIYVVKGSVTITPLYGDQKPQTLHENNGTEFRSPTGLVRPVAFSTGMSQDTMQCLRSGMTQQILEQGEHFVGAGGPPPSGQNSSNFFKSGPDEFDLDALAPIVSPTQ